MAKAQRKVDNRTAAYMVSVNRVSEVMKLRGWVQAPFFTMDATSLQIP